MQLQADMWRLSVCCAFPSLDMHTYNSIFHGSKFASLSSAWGGCRQFPAATS